MNNSKGSWLPFYAWWVQISLFFIGLYWAFHNGILQLVYQSDISHVTQIIGVVLLVGLARIGWLAYKFAKTPIEKAKSTNFYLKVRKHIEEWNEVGVIFMMLGLFGTIVGFAHLAFSVLGNIDFSTQVDMAALIPKLLVPFGTVFMASGVGILSAIIMKIQTMLFMSYSGISDHEYDVIDVEEKPDDNSQSSN